MHQGFPRLLGDVGGTHARWAWQAHPGAALQDISVVRCNASASLVDSARQYLDQRKNGPAKAAGIGIATAITGDQVRMTNHPWSFSIAELQGQLGLERCLVINDFTALALSLPVLGAADLQDLGGGSAVPDTAIGLLGPGTGLGVSGLVPDASGAWSALTGEGGHVTLAAADDGEEAIISLLRARFGHASAERALSGPGLVNLYEAACKRAGVAPDSLTPDAVGSAAAAGSNPHCVQAVQLFASLLGNVAGNLALSLGARGGIYLGGGVVPRLGTAFDAALFRRRFEAKGRFASYLAAVPTWLITAATPALTGAARALDTLPA